MLGIGHNTVRRRCDDGTLEAVRFGGRRLVKVESIERVIAGGLGDAVVREREPLLFAGDPVAKMAAVIGLSPRLAALRPDLAEHVEVVAAGEHLAAFARSHCRYIELGEVGEDGPSLGDPYELVEHEREFFDEALACDARGRRIYRRAGLVIPRKNRKTTSCSVLSLYMASPADGEHRPSIIQAAGSKGQAAKLYKTTRGFIDDPTYASPRLAELFHSLETRIDCPAIAGRIERVAGDGDLNHSLDPHVVIGDELHTWKTPKQKENWSALTSAQGGRLDPLIVFISTEGDGDGDVLADVLQRLDDNPDTEVERRRPGLTIFRNRASGLLVFKYAAAEETTITDVDAILLANPAPWRTRERIAADLADDLLGEATKLRLYANIRSSSEGRWITAERWRDMRDPDGHPDDELWVPEGATVSAATDAALTRDTTAVGWAHPMGDGRVKVRAHVWSVRGDVPHHELVAGGRLDNEDHAEPFVSEVLARRFAVAMFGYDPRYFETEAKHLAEAGLPVGPVEPASAQMADAIALFWKRMLEGKILHDGDPVLAAHVANTGGRQVPRGPDLAWKLFSLNRAKPKDALIAVIIAHYLALRPAAAEPFALTF